MSCHYHDMIDDMLEKDSGQLNYDEILYLERIKDQEGFNEEEKSNINKMIMEFD